MINKILGDKRILTIYIVVICSLTVGFSYALNNVALGFNISTALIAVDDSAYGDTTFDSSNLNFIPILDSDVEISTYEVIRIDFMVGGASTNNASNIIYDIALVDLEVDCGLLSPYIKWKLVKNGTELSSGSLDYRFDKIVNGRLVLTNIQQSLPNYSEDKSGYHNYTFYMWFSDSCQESSLSSCVGKLDQTYLLDRSFSGKIEVELYTEGKKALVRRPSTTLDTSTCISN
jgi:hypothetical protein